MHKLSKKQNCSNFGYQNNYSKNINNIENINQNNFIDFNNMNENKNINKRFNKTSFQNYNDSSKTAMLSPNTSFNASFNNNFNKSKDNIIIKKQIPIKSIKSRDSSRNRKIENNSYSKINSTTTKYVKIKKNFIPKTSKNPIKNIPISLKFPNKGNKLFTKNLSFISKNNNNYEEIDKKTLNIIMDRPTLNLNKKFISEIPHSPCYQKTKCTVNINKKLNSGTERKTANNSIEKNIKKKIDLFNELIPKPKKQIQNQILNPNNNFSMFDTNNNNNENVSKKQQTSNLYYNILKDEESDSYIRSCIIIQKIFRGCIQRKKKNNYKKMISYKKGFGIIRKLFLYNLVKKMNGFILNLFKLFNNNKQVYYNKKNINPKKVIFNKIKSTSFNVISRKKSDENNDKMLSEINFLKNQISWLKEQNNNMQTEHKQLQNKINKIKKIYIKYFIYKKEFTQRYLLSKYLKKYCSQIKNYNQKLRSTKKLRESKVQDKKNMKYQKLSVLIKIKQLHFKQKLHDYFMKYYYNALFTKKNNFSKNQIQSAVNKIEIIDNNNVINNKNDLNSNININNETSNKKEKNPTENIQKNYITNNYFANYDNMSDEEKEKLKRNKYLRDLFYNKIKERKNWLHNKFMKFYYKGLLSSIKNNSNSNTSATNNTDNKPQTKIDSQPIENNTQTNIQKNQNNENVDNVKKEENEKQKIKNSGINKARNLRKLLNQKGKEKMEILRKAFYKFQYNGMMCALRKETKNILKQSRLGNSINVEISSVNIEENKNDNDITNSNENNLEENKFNSEKYKKLLSVFYKKELIIIKTLKTYFSKWRLTSKIMSICLILRTSIKGSKLKRKFQKAIRLSKQKAMMEAKAKAKECSAFKVDEEAKNANIKEDVKGNNNNSKELI